MVDKGNLVEVEPKEKCAIQVQLIAVSNIDGSRLWARRSIFDA